MDALERVDAPKGAQLSSLCYVGFTIAHWCDKANADVTFDDVYRGLDHGTLWNDLEAKIPSFDFLGLLRESVWSEQAEALIETLQYVAESFRGRERRKLAIETNGLALLLAFVLEAIQQLHWAPDAPFDDTGDFSPL